MTLDQFSKFLVGNPLSKFCNRFYLNPTDWAELFEDIHEYTETSQGKVQVIELYTGRHLYQFICSHWVQQGAVHLAMSLEDFIHGKKESKKRKSKRKTTNI